MIAVSYEILFKKALYRAKLERPRIDALALALLLAQIMTWLFYGLRLTSFWASTISLSISCLILLFFRKDLFLNSFLSGVLAVVASIPFYGLIIMLSPEWIDHTYLPTLSGVRIVGIPVEEFVFWFLSGLVFGPFYEYRTRKKLRSRVG